MANSENDQMSRVDVVFLAYNAAARKNPIVTLDSVCTVSLYQLERHLRIKRAERASMSAAAYKHYRWYNGALVMELRTTGKGQPRPLLRAFHWYIETSNVDAFRIDGQQCEAVSLVVAAEVEHWYCARSEGRSSSGRRARVTSCSGFSETSAERIHNAYTAAETRAKLFLKSNFRTTTTRMTLERINEEV